MFDNVIFSVLDYLKRKKIRCTICMCSLHVSLKPLTFILLMWRIGRAPNSIPIYSYIQQDAASHSLFISGNCSTCFGWYFHPSSGAHTTVSTASGICYTVTDIWRYRGRVGTGLSVLWVAYTTIQFYALLMMGGNCMRSWWWVEVPPETCRAVSRYK
jgi:hypothetical protein